MARLAVAPASPSFGSMHEQFTKPVLSSASTGPLALSHEPLAFVSVSYGSVPSKVWFA